MAAVYIIAGIMHFARPKMYMRTLPGYLPGHRFLVAFSGLAEIFLGVAPCSAATKKFCYLLRYRHAYLFFYRYTFHAFWQKSINGPTEMDVDLANSTSIFAHVLGLLVFALL